MDNRIEKLVDKFDNKQLEEIVQHLLENKQLVFHESNKLAPKNIKIGEKHFVFEITRKDIDSPSFIPSDSAEEIEIPSAPPPYISL